jgi:hypothetical protein
LNSAFFKNERKIDKYGEMQNPNVYLNARKLVSYFYPGLSDNDVIDYMIKIRNTGYTLPFIPEFDIPVIGFYTNAIVPLYQKELNKFISYRVPSLENVYGCTTKGVCATLNYALSEFSEPDEDFIDDPYVFYEMLIEGKDVYKEGKIRFEKYMTKLLLDLQGITNNLSQLTQNYSTVSLKDGRRFDETFLKSYRKFIDTTVELIDQMGLILNIRFIVRKLLEMYPSEARKTINNQNVTYNQLHAIVFEPLENNRLFLNSMILSIHEDIGYINTLNANNILSENPNARWLFTKLPTLMSAISEL